MYENKYPNKTHSTGNKPMSTSKSAYEIRESLLQLAYKIVHDKHNASNNTLLSKGSDGDVAFTSPTTAEVIAEASALNEFVSSKSGNC